MTEHNHDHDHSHEGQTMVCNPACTICLKNQTQLVGEVEAFEHHLHTVDDLYAAMGEMMKGQVSPSLEAILSYFRDLKKRYFLQELESGMGLLDANEQSEGTMIILSVLFGQELGKAGFDFGTDIFHHTAPQPEMN